jgi:hypothetical protein
MQNNFIPQTGHGIAISNPEFLLFHTILDTHFNRFGLMEQNPKTDTIVRFMLFCFYLQKTRFKHSLQSIALLR